MSLARSGSATAKQIASHNASLSRKPIPYEVSQLVKDRRQGMQVIWRYELAVSHEDEQRAKELLQVPETVADWSSEN
jgi:hypothetical protein